MPLPLATSALPAAPDAAPFLVQVVPVGGGGVRDCAAVLQEHWFGLGQPGMCLELDAAAVRRSPLTTQLHALAPAQDAIALLLHYSAYGYQRRGLGWWLADELQRARHALGRRLRVVTFFHELHASGPPWGSAFWLGGLQAHLGSRLVRWSDGVWTNADLHARWLQPRAGGRVVAVRPVISTIGEPGPVPLPGAREQTAVLFGSAATRMRALRALAAHLPELRHHGVQGIVEAGTGSAVATGTAGMPCRFVGALPPDDLGRLLAGHRFALIDYPATLLAKSSVFAALAAHGCVVFNTRPPGRGSEAEPDGLRSGLHYIGLGQGHDDLTAPGRADAVARAALHWYAGHRAALQAVDLLRLLRGETPPAYTPGLPAAGGPGGGDD